MVKSLERQTFIDEGFSLSYSTMQFAKDLHVKPPSSKTVHINSFGGATSSNTCPVASINIITDEEVISLDTLIKDMIVTATDHSYWDNSPQAPHITSLQIVDDCRKAHFPGHPNSHWSGCGAPVPET